MSKFIIALSIVLVIILVLSFFIILNKHVVPNLHQSFCDDTYHFFPNSSEDRRFSLEMLNDDGTAEILLRNCEYDKVEDDKLFVMSTEEGYCIIDLKTKQCRIFITLSDEEFISGWGISETGEKIVFSRKVENSWVTYLDSFTEFTEEEQKVFEEMKKSKIAV